jgi:hypothetical protein
MESPISGIRFAGRSAVRVAPRAVVLRDSLILYKAVIYPHNRRV